MPKGEYLQYGGQAVPEGVMMRSPHFYAVAVRAPNGQVVVDWDAHEKTWIMRQKWTKWPMLRGAIGIIDAMMLGYKSMRFAADVGTNPIYAEPVTEESAENAAKQPIDGKGGAEAGTKVVKADDKVVKYAVGAALVVGLALGFFLFNYLPNLLAIQFGIKNPTQVNLLTESLKVVFFVGYLALIAQMGEIKRLFQYHGAEHKAINVIENDLELTVENVQKQSRLHPRCGTSFAIVLIIVGFVLFTFLPKPEVANSKFLTSIVRVLIELPLMFPLAGVSYELIRWAGKMRNSWLVRVLFAPGLWTQLITTKEPSDDMVEVAMVSLQKVLDLEAERANASPEPAVA